MTTEAASGAGRWSFLKLSRKRLWELFLQFFAVMLGVIVATGVSSWREERAARELEARALQAIANEIAFNRRNVAGRQVYYANLASAIEAMRVERQAPFALAEVEAFSGLNPVILRRSSFEVALATRTFGRSDFALAEEVAKVYALQDWVYGGIGKWMDYIVQHSEGLDLPPAELAMIMTDWAGMCAELLAAYESLAPQLPPPLGREPGP